MKFLLTLTAFLSLSFSYAQKITVENNKLVLAEPVSFFKAGTASLTAEGKEALLTVKDYLTEKTYISTLRVEGHLDNSSGAANAQLISEARARAVCQWLVKNGVDCKRLLPVGFGDTKPVAANNSPEGRAANNRMELVIAGLRNRAIGGMPLDGGGKVAGDPCTQQ